MRVNDPGFVTTLLNISVVKQVAQNFSQPKDIKLESTGISDVSQNKERQFEHGDNRNNNKTAFFFSINPFRMQRWKID